MHLVSPHPYTKRYCLERKLIIPVRQCNHKILISEYRGYLMQDRSLRTYRIEEIGNVQIY